MKQFDVYLVDLEPARGSEIKKQRTAVIISPDVMNKHLKTVIVAPLTSTTKNYPSRVGSSFQNRKGEIAFDQMRAIDKSRLARKLGSIDAITASRIKAVIKTIFS